jgi:hypothetical protein
MLVSIYRSYEMLVAYIDDLCYSMGDFTNNVVGEVGNLPDSSNLAMDSRPMWFARPFLAEQQ